MASVDRLTDKSVAALQPGPKDVLIYEPGGFGIRVTPSGGKTFVVQVRHKGQSRRFAIGPALEWKVKEARDAAQRLAADIRGGLDPVAERAKRETIGLTLAEFWMGFLKRAEGRLQPLSVRSYKAVFSRYLKPVLGGSLVIAITRASAWDLHARLREGAIPTLDGQRLTWERDGDKPVSRLRTANKAVQLLRLLLSDAEDQGLIPVNSHPLRDMGLPVDNERKAFLDDDGLAHTFAALDKLQGHGISRMSADFLRVMLLTGARAIELQALHWDQIDEGRKVGILPRGKNGDPRVLPLAGAWDVLTGIPRSTGRVFWGRSPDLPFVKFRDAWRKVRTEAKLGDIKPHDLRHTFASAVLAQGHGLATIGPLLGHRSVASTRRYAHLAPSAANQIAMEAAAAMASAGKGGSATGKVRTR